MELLTMNNISNFRGTYDLVERKYAESFPEHALNQENLVRNR